MPRRSKVASFLVMPIAFLFWIIGWSLYFVGSKKESVKQRPKPKFSIEKELVIFVPTPEQKIAT
jgi:hypothetical protein